MRDTEQASELRDGDVVLGDDWVIPQDPESAELRASRRRRNLFSMRGSPLAQNWLLNRGIDGERDPQRQVS